MESRGTFKFRSELFGGSGGASGVLRGRTYIWSRLCLRYSGHAVGMFGKHNWPPGVTLAAQRPLRHRSSVAPLRWVQRDHLQAAFCRALDLPVGL